MPLCLQSDDQNPVTQESVHKILIPKLIGSRFRVLGSALPLAAASNLTEEER